MTLDAKRLETLANEAAEEFDALCATRMQVGEEKYGPAKFLTVDTLEEALFELADLSNYAKMTFARVRILQAQLESMDEGTLGADLSKELDG